MDMGFLHYSGFGGLEFFRYVGLASIYKVQHQFFLSYNTVKVATNALLSLVRNLHDLTAITQRHTSRIFLRTNSTRLGLVLNESNPLPTRHQSNLPEALKPTKDGRQRIDIITIGQVLHEKNLVRRQVFIRDNSRTGRIRRLETRATGGLDGPCCSVGRAHGCRSEALLLLCRLGSFLLVCYAATPLASNPHNRRVRGRTQQQQQRQQQSSSPGAKTQE